MGNGKTDLKEKGREINYLHQSLSQLVSQEGELEIKISHMIGVNYKRLGKHGAKWMQARIYVECERMGGRRIAWGEYMWGVKYGTNILNAKGCEVNIWGVSIYVWWETNIWE